MNIHFSITISKGAISIDSFQHYVMYNTKDMQIQEMKQECKDCP